MTKFTITCFCRRSNIKFRSVTGYSTEIIARLYCPFCSCHAPQDELFIQVEGMPKKVVSRLLSGTKKKRKYFFSRFQNF
jgi:hypothetical protein